MNDLLKLSALTLTVPMLCWVSVVVGVVALSVVLHSVDD